MADATKSTKPLFVPLNAEHYDNFADGSKTFELRKGPQRWNTKTVYTGRQVVLSRGYSKQSRMIGTIGNVYQRIGLLNILGIEYKKCSLWIYILPDENSARSAVQKAIDIFDPNKQNFIAFECLDLKAVDHG